MKNNWRVAIKKQIMLYVSLFIILFSVTSCSQVEEHKTLGDHPAVIKWFDHWEDLHNGKDISASEQKEYNLDEFPEVTFRCSYECLEVVTDTESIPLFYGMPIWNVYFYDLTGDGYPEICSTISIGSGIIDERIIIYDYANGASYELSDRSEYDYVLRMEADELLVEKRANNENEILETGKLAFIDNTVTISPESFLEEK